MKTTILAAIILLLMGCASTPPTQITYDVDRFGVPVPVVNGLRYEMTDEERRAIGQAFVNQYCSG